MKENELVDQIQTLIDQYPGESGMVIGILNRAIVEARQYDYTGLDPFPIEKATEFVTVLNPDTGALVWNKVALIKAIRTHNGATIHQGCAMAEELIRTYEWLGRLDRNLKHQS